MCGCMDENANVSGQMLGNGKGGRGDEKVRSVRGGAEWRQEEKSRDVRGGHSRVSEDDEGGEGESREYLRCIPKALGKGELEWEMLERKNRKKNLIIRGIRTVGKGLKGEVKSVIKKMLGIEIYISKVTAIAGGLLVKLVAFENKLEILKKKGMLKGINLWIEEDLTEREKEIQEWLGKIAKEEEEGGREVRMGYLKINIEGNWYEWDEGAGRIEPRNFRE